MSLRFPIALVLSLVCLATPVWADYKAGMDAYNRGDYPTALHEWRPLADQEHAGAQFNLGQLYANGQGVPQDYATARQWWEKAAAQGYARAQNNLGRLYANGRGVPQDYATARQWWEKAAAQGYARAQNNLGRLYANGRGVPQDYVRAYMWWSLAAADSASDVRRYAESKRDEVARFMTPAQIAEAQKLAREWKPKTP